jgi:Concanavalin A-like lectin/glucanases superfamily/IPT/TIG domain
MIFTLWLRKVFGPWVRGARASRRGKSRQLSQHRYVPRLESLEDRLVPTTLLVNSLADSGKGTLRDAIGASVDHLTDGLGQTGTGNDTIVFSPSIDGGTIQLSTFANDLSAGSTFPGPSAFRINTTLKIDGESGLTKGITIARDTNPADYAGGQVPNFRLFFVDATGSLTLTGLTLENGLAQGFDGDPSVGGGGGGGAAGLGGAIYNRGSLTIQDSTLTGNTAQGGHGGGSGSYKDRYSYGGGGGGLGSAPVFSGPRPKFGSAAGHMIGGGPNGGDLGAFSASEDAGWGGGGFGGEGDMFGVIGIVHDGSAGGFGGGGGGGGGSYDSAFGVVTADVGGNGGSGGFGGGGGGGGQAANGSGATAGGGGYGGGNGSGQYGGGGAGMGGAIFSEGNTVVITNSTFTLNTAKGGAGGSNNAHTRTAPSGQGLGGAIFSSDALLEVTNCTIAVNTADVLGGTGIFVLADGGPSTAVINNTILDDLGEPSVAKDLQTGARNGGTILVSGKTNLMNQTYLPSTLTGTVRGEPMLLALYSNGGPTPTMALQPGSAAIDAGTGSLAPRTDQRGFFRDADPDIGAYEVRQAYTLTVTTTDDALVDTDTTKLSLRDAIDLANGTLLYSHLTSQQLNQVHPVNGSVNTINFAPSLVPSSGSNVIVLSAVGDRRVGASAFLVNSDVVIDGPSGDGGILLDINQSLTGTPMRFFDVTTTGSLTLQNLNLLGGTAQGLAGGNSPDFGEGGGSAGLGGAIFNQGSLAILDSTLRLNTAQGGAGGSHQSGLTGHGGAGGAGLDAAGGYASGDNGIDGSGPYGGYGSTSASTNGMDGRFGGGGGGGFGDSSSPSRGGAGGFGGGGGGGGSPNGYGGNGGFGGGGGAGAGAGGYGGGAGGIIAFGVGGGGGGGAGMGGAIFNEAGTVVITNSTFSGNTAKGGAGGTGVLPVLGTAGNGLGGALFNHNGTVTVTNSTFSLNTADQGGSDVFNLSDGAGNTGTADINNSILGQSGPTTITDFASTAANGGYAPYNTGSHNLMSNRGNFPAAGVIAATDPMLGPAVFNGGPTRTMALLPGSPAIDAGSNKLLPAGVTTDERGAPRTSGPAVDLGAFEWQYPPTITSLTLPAKGAAGSPITLSATASPNVSYLTYTWTVTPPAGTGSPITLTGATASFTPTATGSYGVSLTVSDNTFGGGSTTLPETGLVSAYLAQGNANDVKGANNGTVVGGVTYVAGKVGQAFNFDGKTGYVKLPNNAVPYPTSGKSTTPLTFETWFRTSSGGVIFGQQAGPVSGATTGYVPAVYVGTNGHLYAQMFWGGAATPIESSGVVNDNNWHHVAVVFNGTTETVYLDGVAVGSIQNFSQVAYAAKYSYQFGVGETAAWPGGNGTWDFFKGQIDQPTFYNRALSASDVQSIINVGSVGQSPSIAVAPAVTASTAKLAIDATQITINGFGFDPTAANNKVTFNDGAVGKVTTATATSLTVTFSTRPTATGNLTAIVTTDGVASGAPVQVATIVAASTVTKSTASRPMNAATITITGHGFSPTAANDTVVFNDGAVDTVTSASATSLTVAFTTKPKAVGNLTAVVSVYGGSSGAAVQVATLTPVVTSSTASLARSATQVTINGFGFDPTAANNKVTFNDGAVGTVTAATATALTVTFTTKPTATGNLTAIVTTDGVASGAAVQVATVS